MKTADIRAIRFLNSFVTITFSGLGWIIASILSPARPYVWIISMPIVLYIVIIGAFSATAYINEVKNG